MARTRRSAAAADAPAPPAAEEEAPKQDTAPSAKRGKRAAAAPRPASEQPAAGASDDSPKAARAAKKQRAKGGVAAPVPATIGNLPLAAPEVFTSAAHLKQALAHVVAADALLAPLAEAHGASLLTKLLPQPNTTCFQALAKSIVYQQLAGSAASAIYGRFAALCEEPLVPAKVLAADEAQLRACGLSARKLEYIRSLAQHFEEDTFRDDVLRALPDDQLCETLQQVKGVGRWTVEMLMMFSLGRTNCLPVADLGVRKGMQTLYKLSQLPTPQQMEAIAAKWHPYRSVGVWLQWQVQTPRAPRAARKPKGAAASPLDASAASPKRAPRAKRVAAGGGGAAATAAGARMTPLR